MEVDVKIITTVIDKTKVKGRPTIAEKNSDIKVERAVGGGGAKQISSAIKEEAQNDIPFSKGDIFCVRKWLRHEAQ